MDEKYRLLLEAYSELDTAFCKVLDMLEEGKSYHEIMQELLRKMGVFH